MGLFDLEYQLLLNRYKKWRELGTGLANKIIKEAPYEVVLEAAGELRMLSKNRTIVFKYESESAYLMDRIVFDMEWDGKRGVEHYFAKYKDTLSIREQRILEAMIGSNYSLFRAEEIKKGVGVDIVDVFSQEKLFLCDVNMSNTIPNGCLMSCRIISIDNLYFTSGSTCVFEGEMLGKLKDNFINLFKNKKGVLTWQQMMRKYNPYFFRTMRQSGRQIFFQ